MRIPSSRDRRLDQENTLTPMIDVVFLLLIFFVCASVGQIQESLLPADLPAGSIETADAPEPQERPFGEVWLYLTRTPDETTVVQINQGGRRYTDLEEVRAQLLQLAEQTTDLPVILDIAPSVPLGDVIAVYDTCYEANFAPIQFAADAADLKKP